MQFDPRRDKEQTSNVTGSNSKRQTQGFTVRCMSLKQVADRMQDKVVNSDRIIVVGRVLHAKEIVNRTQVKVTDESAVVTMVDGSDCDLTEEAYYKFVVMIRLDKDEAIIFIQQYEPLQDFSEIPLHMALVMEQSWAEAKYQN